MAASESNPENSSDKTPNAPEPANQEQGGEPKPESQGEPKSAASTESSVEVPVELHAHHVSKLLDEVLEEPEDATSGRRFKHPMALDIALTIGLLVAVGGFFIGLFKMYITHTAHQSITSGNYKAAIVILRGDPLPNFFIRADFDPNELLNQALYLDAIQKLELDNNDAEALKELQSINPGSHFFKLAQEQIENNVIPSAFSLQGGTSVTEQATTPPPAKKPILPEQVQEGSP